MHIHSFLHELFKKDNRKIETDVPTILFLVFLELYFCDSETYAYFRLETN